jgi:putative restriction endonuclease
MNGYIGHTDEGWWRFLRDHTDSKEVNFWRPSGRGFAALKQGEPFFFRIKSPVSKIGGFGHFARYAQLPVWRAWEVFGPANGVGSDHALLEMLSSVAKREMNQSHQLGCIALVECCFFDADDLLPVPETFNPQNVSGSVIDLSEAGGRMLWERCLERAQAAERVEFPSSPGLSERARYGREQRIFPRLGQGSFRLAVADAYGGTCCVTEERALPALEAVHIRPWSLGGTHDLSNGLLLRRDLHRLFDLGYLSVRSDHRLLVSPRLPEEFGEGCACHRYEGRQLAAPRDPAHAPAPEAIAWHAESVFLG